MIKKILILSLLFIFGQLEANVVAVNDTIQGKEDSVLTIKVQVNDDTIPSCASETLVIINAVHGNCIRHSNLKDIIYTPSSGYFGKDSFRYTIYGCTTADSSSAWVYITVKPINQDPVAKNDTVSILEDKPIVIDVQANDYDREGSLLSTNIDTLPKHGSVVKINLDSIQYTPNPNFHGKDSFKYRVCDDGAGTTSKCGVAWVYITVTPVYDTFVLNATSTNVTVPEDSVICIDISPYVKEIDTTNKWSISILSHTLNGKDTVTNRTTVCYRPNTNYNGLDSITIKICDSNNVCKNFKVRITVTPVDDKITAIVDTFYLQINQSVKFRPTVNDINKDNFTLVVSMTTQPTKGTSTLTLDTIKYVPNPNFVGIDSQIYKISVAGKTLESSAKIIYIITDTVTPPVANPDVYYVYKRTTKNLNVMLNDTVLSLSYKNINNRITFVSTPSRISASIHGNLSWITITGDSVVGRDTFYYRMCDKYNHCDTALVIVITTDSIGTYFKSPDTANLVSGIDYTGTLKGYQNNLTNPLTYRVVTNGSIQVTIDSTGKWTYNYPNGFEGKDSFLIIICDDGNPIFCDTIKQYVIVTKTSDSIINISNSLSPNGDGVHDYLYIENVHLAKDNTLKVFNRWGDVVLDRANYNNDWYGTNEKSGVNLGTILPDAIYFYVFQYSNSGTLITKSGYINLKR